MTPADTVRSLTARYPLPGHVELLEPFVESVDVRGLLIHTVGLAAESGGECITGSAGSLESPPVARAYMELIERLSIATTEPRTAREQADDAEVVSWRPARSNGVAVGVSFEDAAHRATLELIERDRVLRSWYGESVPRPVDLGSLVPDALLDAYEFDACLFERAQGVSTAGVFGFPVSDAPLIYGFAARGDVKAAICAALDECLQRLGFLWGEAIPVEPPVPAPTPSFHQEHYLFPAHHGALKKWLRGEHGSSASRLRPESPVEPPELEELRPEWLSSSLSVVRANPRGHIPLGFGVTHPLLSLPLPLSRSIHPVV